MASKETALTQAAKVSAEVSVVLRLAPEDLKAFFPLFQRGVSVPAVTGCSLRQLLCDQFLIPADYVTGRITTIFLDHRPVDDMDNAHICEGSRVTLSAAMPGLVGAVMRRSGFYAALRQGITHAETNCVVPSGRGTVRLKLFNLLLPELAPLILTRGVVLERREFVEVMELLRPGVDSGCRAEKVFLSVTVGS